MSSDPEDGPGPAQVQAGEDGAYSVDVRGGMGVQVGEHNTQIIYTYNRLTWTDGVAPPPLVSVSGVVDSPYRGLSAFEEQDAAFFFGREAAATKLLERMSRSLQGAGLLVVSGVSGAGKSSLLRAGVLPRVRGAGLASAPGSAAWPCLVFTPTRAPLDELALRVGLLAGADAAAVRRGLDADPAGFALTARQAALAPPPARGTDPGGAAAEPYRPSQQRRLLVVVDQFEQVFIQCSDEGQRRAFITALSAAAGAGQETDHIPAALVVIGVRADFEARCADYPQLSAAVQGRYLVTAMTERQLRMAITEPAKEAGSRVNDDLVEVLLSDVRTRQPGVAGTGVLPLLSHALDKAWRSRTGEALTLADYERTGGIEGAVADSAQHAYNQLTPGQQAAARQVFTRLTAIGSEGMDTADRGSRAELTEGKSAAEVRDLEAVLETFASQRLLTLAADSVEISHEVLLTAWPLLRDTWLTETHADRIVRTRLHNVATEWTRHSRDSSYLYSGSLLHAAKDTAARIGADPARNPPLSQAERDFLHASNSAYRRRTRRRQAMIAGLLTVTLIAIAAAGIAVHNAASATRQHALALSRQLAAESLSIDPAYPVIARRLAVAAWRVSRTDQAASAITTLLGDQQQDGMLPADPAAVNAVAFSPDGKLLASADGDGTVRLWNPVTGQPVGRPLRVGSGAQGGVNGVAFSPNGKLLASAYGDGIVRLWNPVTGQLVGRPLRVGSGAQGGVNGVAFSPNGKLLASAYGDGIVRLWNPVTGHPVGAPLPTGSGGQGGVTAVAFSPNGKLLASLDADDNLRLWNPATGRLLGAPIHTGSGVSNGNVAGVAFSPNGKLLAGAGLDGTVRLWVPATGRLAMAPLAVGSGGHGGVHGVAFSPNGKLLVGAGLDGTVRLWDPATGHPVGAPLQAGSGADGGVNGVAFSPDGKLLASAYGDGIVRLWDLATGHPVGAALQAGSGADGGVNGVAFSPDGKLLASAYGDGIVRLWDLATGRPVGAPLKAGSGVLGGVSGMAFSPDGKRLATATFDRVRLWNPISGHPVGALQTGSGTQDATGVAFSPDGKLLAIASIFGGVQLWDPVTGHPVGGAIHTGSNAPSGVNGVAFSPNGKLLATAGQDGTVRLWNPVTGHAVRASLQVGFSNRGGVFEVAFSPDGKLLAGVGSDGTVRLWNPATGHRVGAPLRAASAQNFVDGVAFSPNGKLLASAGSDGTVWLWDPVTGYPVGGAIQTGSTAPGGVNGVAFSPNGKLLASADGDGTVRLWGVSLFVHPYASLCAEVGPPTVQNWDQYAPGEPQPPVCD